MKGKSETLSLDRPVFKKANMEGIKRPVVLMALVLFLLAAATATLVVSVLRPGGSPGIEAGIEASSARWSALGEHYATPDYEAIATADSARWRALGEHFTPDYEAIAAANSARYQALARSYGLGDGNLEQGEQANTARWVALGAPFAGAASERKFTDTVWAVEEAFQAGDVDQLIAFYASDAVSLPPGFPPSVGKEAIEADLRWFFGEFELERDFALVDYEVAGTYATRLGQWTQRLTPKLGGDPVVETGRCIQGFKKVHGQWQIVWEIWNTYEPPSE